MPEPLPIPSRSPSPPEDIAAAMGFSSFGAKPNPPKKKRKLADPNSEGSGSNNTPLGMRTRTPGGQQLRKEVVSRDQGQSAEMMAQGRDQQRAGHSEAEEAPSDSLPNPDPLAAAALDQTAGMLLETGLLPQYLDWNEGFAEGGPRDDRNWKGQGQVAGQVGGGGGGEDEMRRQGKRGDGTWDWQALRKGVVVNERGDVAFYDGSFVEDPWRGLGAGSGEGR